MNEWPFPHPCCHLNKICPASFRVTCQWLKFPLNGLRAQSRVSPAVGLLPLASGMACFGMAFPPFLVKQLYRCDSVVISSFVRTGYTARKWGWLLGRIGYSITHHYPLCSLYPKLLEYKRSWIQHVNRMPRNRLPRVMKYYFPSGRRNRGRPLKRLLDTWDRNGSTSGPTAWKIYDDDDDDDSDDDDEKRGYFSNLEQHCSINFKSHRRERTDFLRVSLSREINQLFN